MVRGAKIGDKQSGQSNSKYTFMQYVFFEKKVQADSQSAMGSGAKPPEDGKFSRIFV